MQWFRFVAHLKTTYPSASHGSRLARAVSDRKNEITRTHQIWTETTVPRGLPCGRR